MGGEVIWVVLTIGLVAFAVLKFKNMRKDDKTVRTHVEREMEVQELERKVREQEARDKLK